MGTVQHFQLKLERRRSVSYVTNSACGQNFALMKMYKEDPREQKIDLGVGVYKDADGNTPVMRAIKAADQKLWTTQDSKSYVGLVGDPAFSDAMISLLLADALPRNAIAAAATPGGTGAVRQAFELIKMARPEARVFVSDPTWPNHLSILQYLDMEAVPTAISTRPQGRLIMQVIEDIAQAKAGDVVLLHWVLS